METPFTDGKISGSGGGSKIFGIVVLALFLLLFGDKIKECGPKRDCGMSLDDGSWINYDCDNPPSVVLAAEYKRATENR